jgi:hypothetical protein
MTAEGAQMSPDSGAHLSEVRRRRAELFESITHLEHALAAPVPGRQKRWATRVAEALEELSDDFRDHVVLMEGAEGLNVRLIRRAPRMAHQVERLTKEHTALSKMIGELSALVEHAQGSMEQGESTRGEPTQGESTSEDAIPGGWDEVRVLGNKLVGALSGHRQRGADIVYEAFAVDIGGQD